jgi:solute carrier family 25 phosphate transporter 3
MVKEILKIARDLGPVNLFRGLQTRLVMLGPMIALQFLIYDYIKVKFGLPTTGGSHK